MLKIIAVVAIVPVVTPPVGVAGSVFTPLTVELSARTFDEDDQRIVAVDHYKAQLLFGPLQAASGFCPNGELRL